MPHMPELQGVSGKARYEGGTLHFDVASGTTVGLKTAGATIDLTGLDGPAPQYAAIRMPITGSAQDVIRFLARPKLGLPRDVLYDYRRLGGKVAIDLSLGFPLLNALAVADLDIKAEAALYALLAAGCDRRRRPDRRHGARGIRQLGAHRQRHGQARRQRRRDRLARAVRRQGAVPPPLRAQGHDSGGAGRQGGLPVARALSSAGRSARRLPIRWRPTARAR